MAGGDAGSRPPSPHRSLFFRALQTDSAARRASGVSFGRHRAATIGAAYSPRTMLVSQEGEMDLKRLVRGLAMPLLMLSLGGCIQSTFDIAGQLPAAQPIEAGVYKNDAGEAYTVKPDGKGYMVTKDNDSLRMALFASPENPKFYFVQFVSKESDPKEYGYAIASAGSDDTSFVIYDLQDADVWLMPEDLRKLAPYDGAVFEVADAERDTLHILREIVRLGIELDPQVKKTVYHLVKS
jgi:hypothetical protein